MCNTANDGGTDNLQTRYPIEYITGATANFWTKDSVTNVISFSPTKVVHVGTQNFRVKQNNHSTDNDYDGTGTNAIYNSAYDRSF